MKYYEDNAYCTYYTAALYYLYAYNFNEIRTQLFNRLHYKILNGKLLAHADIDNSV